MERREVLLDDQGIQRVRGHGLVAGPTDDLAVFFVEAQGVRVEVDLEGSDRPRFERQREALLLARQRIGADAVEFRQPRLLLERGGGLHLVGDVAHDPDHARGNAVVKLDVPVRNDAAHRAVPASRMR